MSLVTERCPCRFRWTVTQFGFRKSRWPYGDDRRVASGGEGNDGQPGNDVFEVKVMEDNMKNEELTSAETAARELTLALLFLNRFRGFKGKKANRRYEPWQAWKNYGAPRQAWLNL